MNRSIAEIGKDLLDNMTLETEESYCTGLPIFKCVSSFYTRNNNEIVETKRLLYRSRLSCHCEKCERLKGMIFEDICEREDLNIVNWDWLLNGHYYSLGMVNQTTDWETGYLDDWDWKAVERDVNLTTTR